jgi:hypothetical protein
MAGANDEVAPGVGQFLASHADRNRVIDILKTAFVHGRLTKDELDARVARTCSSRTYAELAAVTADIPPWPYVAQPHPPARDQAGPAADQEPNKATTFLTLGALAGFPPVLLAVAFLISDEKLARVAVVMLFFDVFLSITAGGIALGTAIETGLKNRRDSRQPPGPRGGPGGRRRAARRPGALRVSPLRVSVRGGGRMGQGLQHARVGPVQVRGHVPERELAIVPLIEVRPALGDLLVGGRRFCITLTVRFRVRRHIHEA